MSFWDIGLRFILAIAAGGSIGYEREAHRHPAGLRTHILVCVGAAMVAFIECMLAEKMVQMSVPNTLGVTVTLGRLSAQVISGIGFIGAGTIIITKRNIAGLTTAASVWTVACIGIAAGMGLYGLCVIGAGCTLVVLTVIKRLIRSHSYKIVEISFMHRKETLDFLQEYFASHNIRIHNVDFQVTGTTDDETLYTNIYTLELPGKLDTVMIVGGISEFPNVRKIRTRSS